MTYTSSNKTVLQIIVCVGLLIACILPSIVSAYEPFVDLPGFNYSGGNVAEVVNGVFLLLLAVGAVWGVVKIAIAGVKYTMTDVVPQKNSAKDDIKGVLLGLAILVIPYLILYTINPDLTNLNIFERVGGQGQYNISPTNTGSQGTTIQGTTSNGWPPLPEGYMRKNPCQLEDPVDPALNRTPEECAVVSGCEVSELVYSNNGNVVQCEVIPTEVKLWPIGIPVDDSNVDDARIICENLGGEFYDPDPVSGASRNVDCFIPNGG